MSLDVIDFDHAVEKYHLALNEFAKGNPAPAKNLFSQRNDATLGNPLPRSRVDRSRSTMEQASSNYRDGDATGLENIARV